MRHTEHFVDGLIARDATPIGTMLALASIQPDPDQPRSGVGDLTDLVSSIRQKGVLEPILVRRIAEDGFRIISGERRYRASLEAGLYEIPAIEMDVTQQEALEIALIENLQRQDLTPFEEAEGYRQLAERYEYTHEQISTAVGKSRSVVTESLSLLHLPEPVRESIRAFGVTSKSILLEVLKLESPTQMLSLLGKISSHGLGRDAVRKEVLRLKKAAGKASVGSRAKPYTYQFRSPDKSYRLSVSFRQSTVEPEDLIRILEEAAARLREEERAQDSCTL